VSTSFASKSTAQRCAVPAFLHMSGGLQGMVTSRPYYVTSAGCVVSGTEGIVGTNVQVCPGHIDRNYVCYCGLPGMMNKQTACPVCSAC
jgi:hypothetical protein